MNAAETSASSAMADWTLLTDVSRSPATAVIDTFMIEVSTTRTNIAIASRSGSRLLAAPFSSPLELAPSLIRDPHSRQRGSRALARSSSRLRSLRAFPQGRHEPNAETAGRSGSVRRKGQASACFTLGPCRDAQTSRTRDLREGRCRRRVGLRVALAPAACQTRTKGTDVRPWSTTLKVTVTTTTASTVSPSGHAPLERDQAKHHRGETPWSKPTDEGHCGRLHPSSPQGHGRLAPCE